MKIACAIADDVKEEVKLLERFIKADSRFDLYPKIITEDNWDMIHEQHHFDLLFSDIEINSMNAIAKIKELPKRPELVIISNHPKYTLDAFDINALHFLTKPLKGENILTSLDRAFNRIVLKRTPQFPESIFLQIGRNKYQQIYFDKITHLSAEGEYIKINFTDTSFVMIYERLKNIIKELPSGLFLRIHRAYIVNRKHIMQIETDNIVLTNKTDLPIGGNYKENIDRLLES